MVADQKSRLIAAAAVLFSQVGFGVTARTLTARARVSSGALYEHFDGVDPLLVAASEEAADSVRRRLRASRNEGGLQQLLTAAALWVEEPALACLLGLASAVGVAGVAACQAELIAELAGYLEGPAAKHWVAGVLAALGTGHGDRREQARELASLMPPCTNC